MAGQFVDFAAVKAAVPIEEAISYLGLTMKRQGEQFRSPCPVCKKGGDRALVVTPSKSAFYCFGMKKGGDVIAFVAHVRECGQREAGAMLQEQYCTEGTASTSKNSTSSRSTPREAPPATDGLQPLTHLSTDHPAIEALGLSPEICDALGIGYASKGMMRARVVFPLRLPDGTLCGYMGLATKADQAPLIAFPANLAERIAAPPKQEQPHDDKIVDFKKFYRAS